ncbi:tetratricopeptide repeat protein [Mesorhizobium yinganensis]|uniref:tetratricopeptide repeat protein n=1 Tax=Mesorhizobium yinganensis TaxID=3157707 RepID=UPI0032B73CE6
MRKKPGPTEHPRYRVIPRDSNKLAIFFSGSSVQDNQFHWWNMGQRIGTNVILVNNGRNEWYVNGIPGLGDSYSATVDAFRNWADALGATDIYTCGGSMGGSGALIYGVPLGARVLALGFETHLHFPWGHVQSLMVRDFVPEFSDFRPLVAKAKQRIVVYAGESEPVDLAAAAHIADLPMVETVTLRGVGHGPPSHLRNRGKLDPLFDALLDDGPLPEVSNAGEGLRSGFPEALYAAYCADKEKRWHDLESLARKAVEIYPTSEFATMLLGKALLQRHKAKQALPVLRQAIALHSNSREARLLLALATEKAGDLTGAVALHKDILAQWPGFGLSHYALGRIYAGKKSLRAAIKCLERAVEHDPHRANFRSKLEQTRGLAGALKA